ncbi:calmodulin-binding protein 60 B-like isoform X2 [Tasmannia lanceolata]|uniref:calmodulin-binding protein 60 B-like isoform X2 n=1 Tax=Tasmannia lanceolata TaxID=3420 RepID=UPI004062825A
MDPIHASRVTNLQLHFEGTFPHTLSNGRQIQSQVKPPIQIVISKGSSKEVITSGPLSSAKIEFLVLDGEFGKDEKEDWTQEEFEKSVVTARQGKRPLLIGDPIRLRDGIGEIKDIAITDVSRWMKTGKFRLGARVAGGSITEERVREARSEAFFVKDRRDVTMKHYPPSLCDKIWRLENIAKDGAFHRKLEINTVQEFLQHLVTDPNGLRKKLGSMAQKKWEATVAHAKTCKLDYKQYKYNGTVYGRQVGLLFNCIHEVLEATFDGRTYQILANLSAYEKTLVEELMRQAYANKEDIVEFDGNDHLTLEAAASIPRSSRDLHTQVLSSIQGNYNDSGLIMDELFSGNYNDSGLIMDELFSGNYNDSGLMEEHLLWEDAIVAQHPSPIQLQNFSAMNDLTLISFMGQ